MGSLMNMLGANDALTVANKIKLYVDYFMIAFWVLLGAILIFFLIYVGFRMAKAEDEGARKEAKNQVLYCIIGLIVVVLISVLTLVVIPLITKESQLRVSINGDVHDVVIAKEINALLENVIPILGVVLQIITALVAVFSIYIGWRLMKAEDEGARKEAKKQLLYTLIALVGVVLINTIAMSVLSAVGKPAGASFIWNLMAGR